MPITGPWWNYLWNAKNTNIWAATWQNQQNECAPSEDSDQPGHPPSLIKVFAVRSMGNLRAQIFFMRTAKSLIRLGGCPGWSESSLGAHSLCWFCHVAAHISQITSNEKDFAIKHWLNIITKATKKGQRSLTWVQTRIYFVYLPWTRSHMSYFGVKVILKCDIWYSHILIDLWFLSFLIICEFHEDLINIKRLNTRYMGFSAVKGM